MTGEEATMLNKRLISRPGAVIEAYTAEIPQFVRDAIAEALSGKKIEMHRPGLEYYRVEWYAAAFLPDVVPACPYGRHTTAVHIDCGGGNCLCDCEYCDGVRRGLYS
jgi:hypothetical protein